MHKNISDYAPELQILLKRERSIIPGVKFAYFLSVFAIFCFLFIMMGQPGQLSVIGIKTCEPAYWALFAV
jgi:pilus assembly protein TadC